MATFYIESEFITAIITSVNDSSQKVELTPENYEVTATIESPYRWEVKPIKGYRIDSASFSDGYDESGNNKFIHLEVSEDGQLATIDNVTKTSLDNCDTSLYTPPTPKVAGFNHIYSPTVDELTSFAKERFYVFEGVNVVDLGQFVINILELPFPLPTDVIGDKEGIILGNKRIETQSLKINTDLLEIELGEIEVPYKYNNGYDFVNTVTLIHLPLCETFEISNEYVIGETLTLKYRIDLYSGELNVYVNSSKINDVVHIENSKVGRNIPFIQSVNEGQIIGTQSDSLGNNNIFKPFVEVVRNIPYDMDNPFVESTTKISKLKNESGYVVVTNINLETVATLTEIDSIKNILSQGVIIQ